MSIRLSAEQRLEWIGLQFPGSDGEKIKYSVKNYNNTLKQALTH
jgi:hypothetical protein